MHLVCSAERAQGVLDQIDEIVMGDAGKGWSPKLVWEPLPVSHVSARIAHVSSLVSQENARSSAASRLGWQS